jgi:hypothetical protein
MRSSGEVHRKKFLFGRNYGFQEKGFPNITREAGDQHLAQGGGAAATLGNGRNTAKPVKRAADQ